MNALRTVLLFVPMAGMCFAQTTVPNPTKSKNVSYHAIVQEAQAHVKRLDIEQLRELREAQPHYLLIDVRESEEWATGHAARAVHISKGLIEKEIEATAPDKDSVIVLYCQSGARSALAAENLMRMGYSKVYSLDGGFSAYQAAGLPVDK